jgi:hypothetical protein
MTPSTAAPPPVIPEEVRAFAASRGAENYLIPLLDLARQCFPGAPVSVLLEDDPQIANLRFIVYEVDITGWDADQLGDAYDRWTPLFVQMCPPAVREAFVLGVR